MLLFRFDASPKKLFVSCDYHALSVIWLKWCKDYVLLSALNIQIKYIWKSIISVRKYCTLNKITFHCIIDNHTFFLIIPTQNIVYFSDSLAVKYVNLIFLMKV